MKRTILIIIAALAFGVASQYATAASDIQIRDPWVQAAPPNSKVFAAYMEIYNSGKKPRILSVVSSPAFEQVGIHRSVMHENMAHMEHLKELDIPPSTSVTLKPGGLHLMLMDAKTPVKIGDKIQMTLIFQGGEKIAVTAIVRTGRTGDNASHQNMDHSAHGSH